MDRRTVLKLLAGAVVGGQMVDGFSQTSVNRLAFLLERRGLIRIGLGSKGSSVQVAFTGTADLKSGTEDKRVSGPVTVSQNAGTVVVTGSGARLASGPVVSINPTAAAISINGVVYRGAAQFNASGGSLTVINLVQIDDWLKGVLPAEIGADSAIEALKAQAVVARSEAIFRLKKPPHHDSGYDFCTGVHCQAYKGVTAENAAVIKACDETLGYVLLASGDIVNAVYHNVCGGVTAAAEDVWIGDPVPGLTPVFDTPDGGPPRLQDEAAMAQFIKNPDSQTFCNPQNPQYANYAKKYFRWSKSFSADELQRVSGVGKVTDIVVTERRPSGRVKRLTITGTSGSKTIERELPIRQLLDLWSGLFIVELEKSGQYVQSATFVGAGNGHGVGLCQHGAREIARRGGRFDQILKHYYPTATLQKVYRP